MENLPPRIGIIADDLTGATDVAAVFTAAGFKAEVAIDPTQIQAGDADVLCVTTNSRQTTPEIAASRVQESAVRLRKAGFAVRYKKLDSTAKGNIMAEAIALRDGTGHRKVLLCTANPKHGRTVLEGTLWVREQNSVDLRQRFCGQTSEEILWVQQPISAARLQRLLPGSPAIWVCDAADAKDLATLVRWGEAHPEEFLLTGSAGMAVELAALIANERSRSTLLSGKRRFPKSDFEKLPAIPKPALVIIGSNDPRTADQLENLTRQRATLQLSLNASLPLALESAFDPAGGIVVLRLPVNQASLQSLRRYLQPLKPLLTKQRVGSLLMSGGDTALLVCEWLGATRMSVGGELLPGLVWGKLEDGMAPGLVVCTKPGGFGTPDSLIAATDLLLGRRNQTPAAKAKRPAKSLGDRRT